MRSFSKVSLVSLAILLMAVLAWASDPWKSKPYQSWDQKDIDKVLNNSPWVAKISVMQTWTPGALRAGSPNGGGTGGEMGTGSQPAMGGQPGGGGHAGGGGQPGAGGTEIPSDNGAGARMQGPQQTTFEARWVSSQTMREAVARMEILSGKMSQPNAEQFVAQAQPEYQIVVFGPDMTPFMKLDEAAVAKESYLDMKESKAKLAPASVQFVRAPEGKRLLAVTFNFPKTANGEPTVSAKEKGIELVCKLKFATLKFHFDPRKMEGKQGPDL